MFLRNGLRKLNDSRALSANSTSASMNGVASFDTFYRLPIMITSRRNPLVKRIRKLGHKKYRQQEGAFFIEGIRVVLSAIKRQAPIDTIVYAQELLTSDIAHETIVEEAEKGTNLVEVSSDVFQSISERDNPVGLGAIVKIRLSDVQDLQVNEDDLFVVLDSVSDPGNLGTVMRTMDAVNGAGVILVGESTDPFHPTAVKASMGALFNVPVAEAADMGVIWQWSQQKELHVVATSAKANHHFWHAPYRFPAVLLLGNEGQGLPREVLEEAELAVSIPMYGTASSLNLAVAAGLLLYELRRSQSQHSVG